MDAQRLIARRMVIGLPREGLDVAWERDFASYTPAGVILFGRDFRDLDDLRQLTSKLRSLARPRRIFIAIDEEGGFVSQLGPHLVVPPNAALLARGAAAGDIGWAHEVTGRRLRALGIDWDYAPVADVQSEPRNPVIGPRSFGAAPAMVAQAVGEAVAGLRRGGVLTCLKHFPGHGDTAVDSHLALPVLEADLATIERRDLEPFRANLGADSVMTAHMVVRALDPERPGTFARAVTHGLLRERLGFQGVAITDALEMKGAAEGRDPSEAARMALEAGCDLLLFAFHSEEIRRVRLVLAKALVEGDLDRASFDASRPRLAAFDQAQPEPTAEDLARPLAALTPEGWVERLQGIVERGLVVRGELRAAGHLPLRVSEPAFAYGPTLADELAAAGVPLEPDAGAALELVAVASRVPLPGSEIDRLRERARSGPLAVVGLSNDAFLDDLPEATLRISASDATPLTRRVVAMTVARLRAAASA
jgi:beta-glucosidase-like glycosyl hydrolase